MAPLVTYLTFDSIAERRATLLEQAHASHEELRSKGAAYMLDPDEQAILRELDDLDFLEKSE